MVTNCCIPMIEAATAAGKAVFGEAIDGKPEQAVEHQVAQAAGLATGVGYNYLWAPWSSRSPDRFRSTRRHHALRALPVDVRKRRVGPARWRFFWIRRATESPATSSVIRCPWRSSSSARSPVTGMKNNTITHRPIAQGAADHYGRGLG